jgi:hypothetical protein
MKNPKLINDLINMCQSYQDIFKPSYVFFFPEKVVLGYPNNLDSKFSLKPSLGHQSFFFFFSPFVMGVF